MQFEDKEEKYCNGGEPSETLQISSYTAHIQVIPRRKTKSEQEQKKHLKKKNI